MSLLQARWSAGAVHAATRGLGQSYYSLTLWRSEEEMRAYAHSGSHHRAMMATRELAQSVWFCHWRADRAPDWDEVLSMFAQNAEHAHARAGRAHEEAARAAWLWHSSNAFKHATSRLRRDVARQARID